jgi:hypothetical protein
MEYYCLQRSVGAAGADDGVKVAGRRREAGGVEE